MTKQNSNTEIPKPKSHFNSVLSWVAQTGIPLLIALGFAFNWFGDYKVSNKALIDTLSIVYKESQAAKKVFEDYYEFRNTTDSRMNVFESKQDVLDRSYVRTLEKRVEDNDELMKYKDEKIKALDEALKKNN